MNKKVIYSCCVGGYDHILQPLAIDETFDYICFSNDMAADSKIGVWTILPIPFECSNLTILSRYPKLLPHKLLPEYDYSVYIDANIQILNKEFYDVINSKIASGCLVSHVRHSVPPIDCIYEEISYAYKFNKVSFWDGWRQAMYLKGMGFPRHYGLYENNLIGRFHNNEKVMELSIQWWNEFVNHSPRDQFSLMYVYWKNHFTPECLFKDEKICTRNSSMVKYHQHALESSNIGTITLKTRIAWRLHRMSYYVLRAMIWCALEIERVKRSSKENQ